MEKQTTTAGHVPLYRARTLQAAFEAKLPYDTTAEQSK